MNWLIPVNPKTYNHKAAFETLTEVDWRHTVNYTVGDKIFIYVSAPTQQIKHLCEVTKININSNDLINDKKYWVNPDNFDQMNSKKISRFKLIREFSENYTPFSYNELKKNGLNGSIQGPRYIDLDTNTQDELGSYVKIHSLFTEASALEIEASDFTSIIMEGEKKQYYTYKYERSSKLREQAIDIHGLKCNVCEFDFEKAYGQLGKGYIEIHHTKPLFSLTEPVEINPAVDLVPLCANCHRMVHRKKSDVLSIEELKGMIKEKPEIT